MEKKKKTLKLEELKVKSFITDINGSKMKTIEGGSTPACATVVSVEVCPATAAATVAVAESIAGTLTAIGTVVLTTETVEGTHQLTRCRPCPSDFANECSRDAVLVCRRAERAYSIGRWR